MKSWRQIVFMASALVLIGVLARWADSSVENPRFLIEMKYPRDAAGWRVVAGAENFKACVSIAAAHAKWYDKRMTEPPRVRCVLNRGETDE